MQREWRRRQRLFELSHPARSNDKIAAGIRALLTEAIELPAIPGDSCSFCRAVILADTEHWPYPACDDCYRKCLANAGVGERSEWRSLKMTEPPVAITFNDKPKPYVLAIDSKDRMSVGWAYRYSTGKLGWTFAKPIGQPTHWMPLPTPPTTRGDESK